MRADHCHGISAGAASVTNESGKPTGAHSHGGTALKP